MSETNLKKCGKCKVSKPLDQFHANAEKPDGKHNWCKECHNEWSRARSKTPEGRNEPYRRKRWADGMMSMLNLTDNDY